MASMVNPLIADYVEEVGIEPHISGFSVPRELTNCAILPCDPLYRRGSVSCYAASLTCTGTIEIVLPVTG